MQTSLSLLASPIDKGKNSKKKKGEGNLPPSSWALHVLQAPPFPMIQIVPFQTLKLVPSSRSSSF